MVGPGVPAGMISGQSGKVFKIKHLFISLHLFPASSLE
jgi:hypothetical protein